MEVHCAAIINFYLNWCPLTFTVHTGHPLYFFALLQVRGDGRRERRPDAARAPVAEGGEGGGAAAARAGRGRGAGGGAPAGAAQGRKDGRRRRRRRGAQEDEEGGEQDRVNRGKKGKKRDCLSHKEEETGSCEP